LGEFNGESTFNTPEEETSESFLFYPYTFLQKKQIWYPMISSLGLPEFENTFPPVNFLKTIFYLQSFSFRSHPPTPDEILPLTPHSAVRPVAKLAPLSGWVRAGIGADGTTVGVGWVAYRRPGIHVVTRAFVNNQGGGGAMAAQKRLAGQTGLTLPSPSTSL